MSILSGAEEELGELVYADGEVRVPGRYKSSGLMEILHAAKGLTNRACVGTIMVSGYDHERTKSISYKPDIIGIFSKKERDLLVPPGWIVTVEETFICFEKISPDTVNKKLKAYMLYLNENSDVEYNLEAMKFYNGN